MFLCQIAKSAHLASYNKVRNRQYTGRPSWIYWFSRNPFVWELGSGYKSIQRFLKAPKTNFHAFFRSERFGLILLHIYWANKVKLDLPCLIIFGPGSKVLPLYPDRQNEPSFCNSSRLSITRIRTKEQYLHCHQHASLAVRHWAFWAQTLSCSDLLGWLSVIGLIPNCAAAVSYDTRWSSFKYLVILSIFVITDVLTSPSHISPHPPLPLCRSGTFCVSGTHCTAHKSLSIYTFYHVRFSLMRFTKVDTKMFNVAIEVSSRPDSDVTVTIRLSPPCSGCHIADSCNVNIEIEHMDLW